MFESFVKDGSSNCLQKLLLGSMLACNVNVVCINAAMEPFPICCESLAYVQESRENTLRRHILWAAWDYHIDIPLSTPRLNNQQVLCTVGIIPKCFEVFQSILAITHYIEVTLIPVCVMFNCISFLSAFFRFVVCCNGCLIAIGIWHKMSCTSQQAQSSCDSTFMFNFLWKKVKRRSGQAEQCRLSDLLRRRPNCNCNWLDQTTVRTVRASDQTTWFETL